VRTPVPIVEAACWAPTPQTQAVWLKVLWSWRMIIARKEDMLWSRWGAK
jgi:hypothetical protein